LIHSKFVLAETVGKKIAHDGRRLPVIPIICSWFGPFRADYAPVAANAGIFTASGSKQQN
jgi:hypothetical protein